MTRPSTAAPILAVLGVVLVTLGAYVGGCLWLGEQLSYRREQHVINGRVFRTSAYGVRLYSTQWQAALFCPAARLESWLRRVKVESQSLDAE
jgi:hypothetical protein